MTQKNREQIEKRVQKDLAANFTSLYNFQIFEQYISFIYKFHHICHLITDSKKVLIISDNLQAMITDNINKIRLYKYVFLIVNS